VGPYRWYVRRDKDPHTRTDARGVGTACEVLEAADEQCLLKGLLRATNARMKPYLGLTATSFEVWSRRGGVG
jgi:hypothetical protein